LVLIWIRFDVISTPAPLLSCENDNGKSIFAGKKYYCRPKVLFCIWQKLANPVILDCIKDAVDVVLRQNQAGFWKGRSYCKQIFSVWQIIEKSTALDSSLLINCKDFRKAFDCVHKPSVWKTLKCYGIPEKIIGFVQNFHKDSRCAVRAGGEVGDWFKIVTGVWQGCLLSPLIYLLVMDWIWKRATDKNECGLQWIGGRTLTDLDFGDDTAVLNKTWTGMQKHTNRV